ncbi:unnamed protein product [Larinioides sclopetarius]|uniref:Uncharacterized protein n=1 Tax=Larinioides sclopetarius TaxID=280406 RepID=A0AAV1YXD9_9ARAC
MASTKKSGFIVETKSVSEKKRRKSDLVVMWITLWDVILYIATEIFLTFQGVVEVGSTTDSFPDLGHPCFLPANFSFQLLKIVKFI